MGWLNKRRKGLKCEQNQDGSVTCTRLETDKNGEGLVSRGTTFTIGADAKNGCKPFIVGDVSQIMDDDMDAVDRAGKLVSQQCQRM